MSFLSKITNRPAAAAAAPPRAPMFEDLEGRLCLSATSHAHAARAASAGPALCVPKRGGSTGGSGVGSATGSSSDDGGGDKTRHHHHHHRHHATREEVQNNP